MGVGAGLYMCDVVKQFTFAISYPDEFLLNFLYDRPMTDINVIASVCALNLRIRI